jgi:hypothetical protein
MKVGITVASSQTSPDDALWSNGVGQNIAYLAMLLQRLVIVDQVVLIGCPEGDRHPIGDLLGLPVLPRVVAVEELDLIIELGARAIEDIEAESLRKRGGKLVSYMAGNVMAMNFEELASNVAHGDQPFLPGFDAVWITPQHWHMCHSYAELIRSPHTERAPHIWNPYFLKASAFVRGKNIFYRKPPGPGWRLGVFDPNVNVVKTFHLPLMVAEEAYRLKPDLIKAVLLFNAYRLRENQHLLQMFAAMNLGQANKVTVENRHPLADVMGLHIDAVVTHQWENNLNYLYWEILYLGYPLIHNSTAIKDVGYYYPEFDPQTGGQVLCDALENHDERRMADRPAVMEALWQFSIDNPVVQQRYTELIESVMSQPSLVAKPTKRGRKK